MPDHDTTRYLVPALLKAVDILEFIASRGTAGLMDVVKGLGLPKTSTYQLLNTLVARGLLSFDPVAGYSLGLGLFTLGNLAIRRLDIRREALPIMRRLSHIVGHTCHMGVLDGVGAVYLAKAEAPESVIVNSWVGKRLSLQTSAMGKALLAWRDPAEVRAIISRNPPEQFTERSILDPEAFLAHLEQVRARGWALDDRENVEHNRCLAVPIMRKSGEVAAALSISALFSQLPDEALEEAVMHLKAASANITEHLTHIGK
jgi:DNA-binding IclR family transcriptional regulator